MHRRAVLLASVASFFAAAQPRTAAVPYAGCRSDTFVEGPLGAPAGPAKKMRISSAMAQRLAYYEAATRPGVLGPRGWNCFGTMGSAGATLVISPRPISTDGPDLTGPIILLLTRSAETSGRFDVATIIARVFPAHREFVARVLAEGTVPGLSFPSGPYPNDKVSFTSAEVVEYETPAQTDGLGTYAGLKKNADPIRGRAMLIPPALDLILLSVRLPADLRDLATTIVQHCCSYADRGK